MFNPKGIVNTFPASMRQIARHEHACLSPNRFPSAPMKPPPLNMRQQLAEAISLFQQGQLDAAQAGFKAVLKRDSRNFDALHFCGVAAAEAGRLEEGVNLIRRALAVNPRIAEAHANLGSALIRSGRYEEALVNLDRALALDPKAANAHHNRGYALMKLRRLDQAIAAFDRALELKPDHSEAHNDRANALSDKNKPEEALAGYEKALSLRPGRVGYMVNVALALCSVKRHADALAMADKARQAKPDDTGALVTRAQALLGLSRPADALVDLDAALLLDPGLVQAHVWRCMAFMLLARPEDALATAEIARAMAPKDGKVHNAHGMALGNLNRFNEALVSYDHALKLSPNDRDILWNRALALLVLGRFQEGWLAYEYRNLRISSLAARSYPKPLWWGKEPLQGQRLFVYWEQGFGDTLQFARYVPLVAAAGAQVTFSVQDALRRIFKDLDPSINVIGQNDEPGEFDLHCPLLSLPLAFNTRLETIPAWTNGYLKAPAEEVARWDRRLPAGRRRIGLVWSGNQSHGNDANRSMSLARLKPLFRTDDVWVSLQKDVREAERAAFEASGLLDVSTELGDFADTAALISALDLVIAVDTSVAHLAGALGKATWLMVPFSPDFRWLLDREDFPWYPEMRLFRQTHPGDWEGVVARIGDALRL